MKEEGAVLHEEFFFAEYIDDEGNYIKTKYRKLEQYSFYLRFLSRWFIPCQKDQTILKEHFLNAELNISQQTATINFYQNIRNNKLYYSFNMRFIGKVLTWEFRPCQKCQKEIRKSMEEAESVTIGNEKYEHPVEFNRRIVDDDQTFFTVEKHKATKKEQTEIGDKWIYTKTYKETYDKTPIIKDE